ncbi:MAG: hypothetical protein AAB681_02170, partial [Patescibacteria group bacterium]
METENNSSWVAQFKASSDYLTLKEKPIAYFSAEYALSPLLPTYAGGLGILAGDIVKEASASQLPIVFVGLFYKKGQNDIVINSDIKNSGVELITNNSVPVTISIPISNRHVFFQVWLWNENGASVYLLDTDVPQNSLED